MQIFEKTKQVAILGFGEKEGKATLEYLLKHGVRPTLFDQRVWQDFSLETQNYIKEKNVPFVFGPGYLDELKSFEIAFRNPAVPFLLPQLQKLVKRGLIVTSQTKWFFEHCPAKIIGVTGTKGKGTTCALIYEILQANSYKPKTKSYLTGNIGKIQPFEFLDNLTKNDWVVFELSSFQLQDLDKSPHIAVVLMVTSEHLDYHKNQNEYLSAKEPITKFQTVDDFAVINMDFENSIKIGQLGQGRKLYFSLKTSLELGCFIKDNNIILKNKDSNFQLPISNFQLRGKHNQQNICAAALAATCTSSSIEVIDKTINEFKGLEHRLEFVMEKGGIKFYNDSFSTTPETAIAAIESFAEPLIIILGGSTKNSNFTELGRTIRQQKNIKALVLIGQEAAKIKQAIGSFAGSILEGSDSMSKIFKQIKSISVLGDTVLFSPACASFDMFKNYQDRGQQFKTLVKSLN